MSRNRSMVKTLVLALTVVVLFAMPVAGAFAQDMTNGITTPADGATVSGIVEVKGYANDPDFMKWQLDVLPGGDSNAGIFVASSTIPGEFTYALNTTAFPAGEHALRLRVVRKDSNYTEYVNKFTIGAPAAAVTLPAVVPAATAVVTPTAPVAVAAAPVAMTNGLTLPKTITETLVVSGYATDPTFNRWQLDVLPGGDENAAIFLAIGKNSGVFTHTVDTTAFPAGEHALRLRVVREDSNYSEYVVPLVLGAAAAAAAPAPVATPEPVATEAPAASAPVAAAAVLANGFTGLQDGATLKGLVEVKGVANDANFNRWQLDVLPGGDSNAAIFVATGATPGEFVQALDTTAFPNGEHALRLRVVRNDSNYDEYVTKINIAN